MASFISTKTGWASIPLQYDYPEDRTGIVKNRQPVFGPSLSLYY